MSRGQDPVDRAIETYGSLPPAQAIASQIPLISGLGAWANGIVQQRLQRRVDELGAEVTRRLDGLESGAISDEYVKSEDFQTLFFRAFRSMTVTHQREKLVAFANVLASCALKKNAEDVQKERYLILLDELTVMHIQILSLFSARLRQLRPNEKQPVLKLEDISTHVGIPTEDADGFCADLVARGLLQDAMAGASIYQPGNYRLSPGANRFLDYIFAEWPSLPKSA